MDEQDKKELIERYGKRLRENGYSPEALGWTKRKHRLRYHLLLSYWNLDSASDIHLLDFGCGFGDLFRFCAESNYGVRYTGIDINEELIAVGRRQHPDARLVACDAEVEGLGEDYDIIVASGIHNATLRDNWKFIEWSFETFFRHARIGFAMNFLSDRVNRRHEGNFYASPEQVLALAFRYSRRIVLRHDAMPFEFTILVDKRDAFDEKTVFSGFEPFVD